MCWTVGEGGEQKLVLEMFRSSRSMQDGEQGDRSRGDATVYQGYTDTYSGAELSFGKRCGGWGGKDKEQELMGTVKRGDGSGRGAAGVGRERIPGWASCLQ